MATSELKHSVAGLILEHPRWIDVLERLEIDFCCHGDQTFEHACAERGLDPHQTLDELLVWENQLPEPHLDTKDMSVEELVDHIVLIHHNYLRQQLPKIDIQLGDVLLRHGTQHRELATIKSILHELRDELENHMLKEELVLFPWAKRLSRPNHPTVGSPPFSVSLPIQTMKREHNRASELLAQIRKLSGDFTPPEDACMSYRRVVCKLSELEHDLHLHIHEENNILFPSVLDLDGDDLVASPLTHGIGTARNQSH